MRYIDFHTHILPGIDDGAKTVEDAVSMLKIAGKCGAETVVLTPHYSASMSVSEFCQKRKEQYKLLENAIKKDGGDFPKLLLGAEVLIDGAISEKEDLEKLCVEGTDLLLLEFPYANWNDWHFQEVYRVIAERNLTPVMAHIERYLKSPKELDKIDKLVTIDARFQVNADTFLTFSGKRIIRALAAEGFISAIGSDCHGIKRRSPNISLAMKTLAQKFGDPFIEYLYKKTNKLLSEHSI